MNEFGKYDELSWGALIGDVVGSRELEDRAGFQERLKGELLRLNRRLGPDALATPLALTAGDELQGLFHRYSSMVIVLRELSERLHPVRIVYGVGFGPLSIPPGPQVALLDGPCFHAARRALERSRREDRWATVEGLGDPEDQVLGALLQLVDGLRGGWTAKQNRYAAAARGRLQKDVAAMFDVSPSVVSESLRSARAETVAEGEAAAIALLEQFCYLTELDMRSHFEPNFAGTRQAPAPPSFSPEWD